MQVRPRARGVVAGAAALGLLTLLVLLVAAAGAVEFGLPRVGNWRAGDGDGLFGDVDPRERTSAGTRPDVPLSDAPWALIVLGGVATALLAVVLRSLRPVGDGRRRPSESPAPEAGTTSGGDDPLPALRRAAGLGRTRLRGAPPGQARDAVVACWLALERAAGEHGGGRGPAQTPTEFTVDLLARHTADPRGTEDLLRLYHRARFSSAPLPPDAGERAASALDRITASLT